MEDIIKDKVIAIINANPTMDIGTLGHLLEHDLIFGPISTNEHVNIDELAALINEVRNLVIVEVPIEATNTPTDEGSTIK